MCDFLQNYDHSFYSACSCFLGWWGQSLEAFYILTERNDRILIFLFLLPLNSEIGVPCI